jgi:hypothetical protein
VSGIDLLNNQIDFPSQDPRSTMAGEMMGKGGGKTFPDSLIFYGQKRLACVFPIKEQAYRVAI